MLDDRIISLDHAIAHYQGLIAASWASRSTGHGDPDQADRFEVVTYICDHLEGLKQALIDTRDPSHPTPWPAGLDSKRVRDWQWRLLQSSLSEVSPADGPPIRDRFGQALGLVILYVEKPDSIPPRSLSVPEWLERTDLANVPTGAQEIMRSGRWSLEQCQGVLEAYDVAAASGGL